MHLCGCDICIIVFCLWTSIVNYVNRLYFSLFDLCWLLFYCEHYMEMKSEYLHVYSPVSLFMLDDAVSLVFASSCSYCDIFLIYLCVRSLCMYYYWIQINKCKIIWKPSTNDLKSRMCKFKETNYVAGIIGLRNLLH